MAESHKLEEGLRRTRLQLVTVQRTSGALSKRLNAVPHLDLRIAHLKAQVGTHGGHART